MAKERPILMSGPMVRAILDGRKTQTRRVVKPQPWCNKVNQWLWDRRKGEQIPFHPDLDEREYPQTKLQHVCPYGVPGDRLWVKETWWTYPHVVGTRKLREGADTWPTINGEFIDYDANGDGQQWKEFGWIKKPSLFMPRWASRITLEITAVRVERLHDIGKDGRKAHDVLAEGITPGAIESEHKWFHSDDSPALAYSRLWDSINSKKHPWSSNPWVWILEFKRVDHAHRA